MERSTFPEGSLAVATDVFLRQIRFEVHKAGSCDNPTSIGGGVTFVAEPVIPIADAPLIQLDADVKYSFPQSACHMPGVLDDWRDGGSSGSSW